MTLLVTGATGNIGRKVIAHLLERGQRVRALSRTPSRSALPPVVEVFEGDLTAPATLGPALQGVTAVFLITHDGPRYAPLQTGQALIQLIHEHGVRRVVTLWRGERGTIEAALESSSQLEWTQLEPSDFMSNMLHWAESIRSHHRVQEPYPHSRCALIHEQDVAEVAARVLVEDGHHGRVYRLTGSEALTIPQRVHILKETLGRDIAYVELSDAQARERWRDMGFGPDFIELLATWHDNPLAYTLTNAVEKVLGRPPLRFDTWAQEHVAAFRAPAAL
ncbi:NAD(P)H-binding protein [Myxococcus landrumensis]|uniref:NAD(P)H-binding protein n=1 Tax=Myxococcus landrumensis TaxID=2813577 RepID=A0ABX7NDF1_9BACT|nr:NAD(P)H-binding protein [Myxococcus landrumus]QSQ16830.1 NAD(P)H-binding protein [Myxococcus landrumus]